VSIRDVIRVRLEEADKDNWWDKFVPQFIRDNTTRAWRQSWSPIACEPKTSGQRFVVT